MHLQLENKARKHRSAQVSCESSPSEDNGKLPVLAKWHSRDCFLQAHSEASDLRWAVEEVGVGPLPASLSCSTLQLGHLRYVGRAADCCSCICPLATIASCTD